MTYSILSRAFLGALLVALLGPADAQAQQVFPGARPAAPPVETILSIIKDAANGEVWGLPTIRDFDECPFSVSAPDSLALLADPERLFNLWHVHVGPGMPHNTVSIQVSRPDTLRARILGVGCKGSRPYVIVQHGDYVLGLEEKLFSRNGKEPGLESDRTTWREYWEQGPKQPAIAQIIAPVTGKVSSAILTRKACLTCVNVVTDTTQIAIVSVDSFRDSLLRVFKEEDQRVARANADAEQADWDAVQRAIRAAGQQPFEGAFRGFVSPRVIYTARISGRMLDLQAVDVLSNPRGQILMMACTANVSTPLIRSSISLGCSVGPKTTSTTMWYLPKTDEWILIGADGTTIRFSRYAVRPNAQ